jgi:hypothetical protein
MADPFDPCFGHMESLLRDWMRGARLLESHRLSNW